MKIENAVLNNPTEEKSTYQIIYDNLRKHYPLLAGVILTEQVLKHAPIPLVSPLDMLITACPAAPLSIGAPIKP